MLGFYIKNMNPDILFRNFDIFQNSGKEAKSLKSLLFPLALSKRISFQKLSNGRIKTPLQSLINEQKSYLKKQGIPFSMPPPANQNLIKFKGKQTTEKPPYLISGKSKKLSQALSTEQNRRFQKEGNASQENCLIFRADPYSSWPMVQLGDVADIGAGNSAPQNKSFFQNGKYPFCRTSDVGKIHISDNFKEIKDYLNDKGIKGLKLFKKDTILFPKSGASTFLNHRVLLGIDSYISSHLATIYANQKIIIPKLLFNLLCFIDAKTLTSTQNYPSLKLLEIKKIKIPLPPLTVQKEIVALMKKCALLEAQTKEKSQKQEELSKSSMHFITQSKNKVEFSHNWKKLKDNFKDILYSQTGAKNFKSFIFQIALSNRISFQKLSNGRVKTPLPSLINEQKSYLQKNGIPFSMHPTANQNLTQLKESQTTEKYHPTKKKPKQDSQALFTKQNRRFHKEGNVSKETSNSIWPMVQLGEVCKIFSGSRPKGGAVKSGVLSIGGEHINSDGSFNLMKPKYIPKKFFHHLKRGKLENKDVLLVKDGATTGKMGYFDEKSPFKTGAVNEHVFILRSEIQKIRPFYLYQFLRSKEGNARILRFKTGSAQGGINLSIKNLLIPLPPLTVQKEIVALMEDIENMENQIQKEKTLSVQLSQSLSYAHHV